MKRTFFLARLSVCCCGVALIFASSIIAQQRRTPRTRRTSKTVLSVKTIAVKEIDAGGLKKLLARDNASQTAPRPLLINFWATWCEPCREEFPDLVRINKYYKTRGLDFVVVSLDDVEELNKGVPQFLREMRATMPAYLLNAPDGEVAMDAIDSQWSGALPATFLFDQQGRIAFKHTGRINAAELRATIEKMMKR
jgi:thiol-disulfide isomerase/thioredoxin